MRQTHIFALEKGIGLLAQLKEMIDEKDQVVFDELTYDAVMLLELSLKLIVRYENEQLLQKIKNN